MVENNRTKIQWDKFQNDTEQKRAVVIDEAITTDSRKAEHVPGPTGTDVEVQSYNRSIRGCATLTRRVALADFPILTSCLSRREQLKYCTESFNFQASDKGHKLEEDRRTSSGGDEREGLLAAIKSEELISMSLTNGCNK